jgi:mono/diheme cytochrome c family protein
MFNHRVPNLVASLFLVASVAACGGDEKKGPDPSVAEASKVFNERCVTCHGADGKGSGPGAAALDPKPRSFASPDWQASADDARIKKVIIEGGASVGLSASMAPNGDLAQKPEVVAALVKKIRAFSQ